jgi:hypothetical protein
MTNRLMPLDIIPGLIDGSNFRGYAEPAPEMKENA